MPKNAIVDIPPSQWVELTDNDVTSITFQNKGYSQDYHNIFIAVTGGATPTSLDGTLEYPPKYGERNVSLSDLFPGGAGSRVFAYSQHATKIFVSHA